MVLTHFYKRLLIKLSIAAGLISVLSAGLVIFNSHLNKLVRQIDQEKAEITLRNRTIELIAGSNTDLKKADPLLARLQSIIPPKDQLIGFSRDISNYGKKFNVDVGFSFGTETAATATDSGSVNFTLSATGHFDDIISFLQFLEQLPYFIRFDGVTTSYQLNNQYNLTTTGAIYTK